MGPIRHRSRLLHPAGLRGRLIARRAVIRNAAIPDTEVQMKIAQVTDMPLRLDRRRLLLGLSGLAAAAACPQSASAKSSQRGVRNGGRLSRSRYHRTKTIDGIKIFYREAGPEGCARRAAAARLSDLVAHVPQPDPGAGGPLSRDRARLSRLRPERHAGPREVRLHVRPLRRTRRRPARSTRRHALRDVCDGLWRAGRLAAGPEASRAHHRPDRAERQRL